MENTNTQTLEVLETPDDSGGEALAMIANAEINQQIATARRFPRTLSKVKADMLSFATLDEDTAQACFYTLPRGGKTIQGPSIRLAEIAISCYGNVRVATRVISTATNGEHPHVTVQAAMHDLEKNVAVCIEKRRRITKKRNAQKPDDDDINLAVNACSAIAFRDAAFKVIPGALIKPVFEQAKLVAVGDVKSLVAKRTAVIARLKQMGATEERILARVDAAKIDDVDLDKLGELIGLGTALKDGQTTLEDAFPVAVKPAKVMDDIPFGGFPGRTDGTEGKTGPVGVEGIAGHPDPVGPRGPLGTSGVSSAKPDTPPADTSAKADAAPTGELPLSDTPKATTATAQQIPVSEALDRLAFQAEQDGVKWEQIEAWAKTKAMDANKPKDAHRILTTWAAVLPAIRAAKGTK